MIDKMNKTMSSIPDEVENDFVDLEEELKFCRAVIKMSYLNKK